MPEWLSEITPMAIVKYTCAIGIACLWVLAVVTVVLALFDVF